MDPATSRLVDRPEPVASFIIEALEDAVAPRWLQPATNTAVGVVSMILPSMPATCTVCPTRYACET